MNVYTNAMPLLQIAHKPIREKRDDLPNITVSFPEGMYRILRSRGYRNH